MNPWYLNLMNLLLNRKGLTEKQNRWSSRKLKTGNKGWVRKGTRSKKSAPKLKISQVKAHWRKSLAFPIKKKTKQRKAA